MKTMEVIEELQEEIRKTQSLLKDIQDFYDEFKQEEFESLGKKKISAIVLAEIIENFYTCVETLFLRISQFFENNLRPEKWHSDLLHKMTLEIKGVRKSVISDETHLHLFELMKFRHFKRHYFEFKYDWDRLEFLEKKYLKSIPLLEKDLKEFQAFLQEFPYES